MSNIKRTVSKQGVRDIRPGLTPEARENQMISLAVDLAERQLLEGTASSQVITHYLKLATTKERIEREILEKQKELISAKTEAIKESKHSSELYANAIKAMQSYSGHFNSNEDEYDEEPY